MSIRKRKIKKVLYTIEWPEQCNGGKENSPVYNGFNVEWKICEFPWQNQNNNLWFLLLAILSKRVSHIFCSTESTHIYTYIHVYISDVMQYIYVYVGTHLHNMDYNRGANIFLHKIFNNYNFFFLSSVFRFA